MLSAAKHLILRCAQDDTSTMNLCLWARTRPSLHRNISIDHPIGKNALKAILSLWIKSGQRNGTKVPDSFCFHWPGLYSRYKGRDTCICFTLLKKWNEVIQLEILTKANGLLQCPYTLPVRLGGGPGLSCPVVSCKGFCLCRVLVVLKN